MFICFAILVPSYKTQDGCKTSKSFVRLTKELACEWRKTAAPGMSLRFIAQLPQECCETYHYRRSPGFCRTDARPHLGHSFKVARPSCDSLACERKTIVRASYRFLTFRGMHFCLRSAIRDTAWRLWKTTQPNDEKG